MARTERELLEREIEKAEESIRSAVAVDDIRAYYKAVGRRTEARNALDRVQLRENLRKVFSEAWNG